MPLKVVISDHVFADITPQREILRQAGAELLDAQCKTIQELVPLAADCDALLNCYLGPIGPEVIPHLKRCRVIVRYGIGLDTIDIPCATRHGIMVCNNPDYCVEEVSDQAAAFILALARRLPVLHFHGRRGVWDFKTAGPFDRLAGQVLGLVGFGKIPRRLLEKLKPWDLKVLAYDPYVDPSVMRLLGAEPVGLDELLERSDFISLHAPATSETHHLINRESLKRVKPTASLINTARGALVDTPALVEALREGRLAGAALDVLEEELRFGPDHPLTQMPNVLLTGHSAWYSQTSLLANQVQAAEEVARVLRGQEPLHCVNRRALADRARA